MKIFKILLLYTLSAGINSFACAMDQSDKTETANTQNILSPENQMRINSLLEVVTDINDIKNIIKDYIDVWIIWNNMKGIVISQKFISNNSVVKDKNNTLKTAITNKSASELDIVTDNNKIQTIIRAYLNEWFASKTINPNSGGILSLCLTHDNKNLISGFEGDYSIKVWGINAKIWDVFVKGVGNHRHLRRDLGALVKTFSGPGSTRSLGVTDDSNYIVSEAYGIDSGYISAILDFKTGEMTKFQRSETSIKHINITSDFKYLVAISKGNSETSNIITRLQIEHDDKLDIIEFHNKHGEKDSSHQYIKIWDLESGKLLHVIDAHNRHMTAIAVTPDNKYVVSSSDDKTIKICDIKTGEIIKTLEGHTGSVECVTVTHDGKYIISGSWDNTIKIWNFKTGKLLHTLEGHLSWINAIVVTSDGKTIISGSNDRTIKIWKNLALDLKKQQISADNNFAQITAKCANLGCTNPGTKRCAQCKLIHYCSQECQKAHWPNHKVNCK